MLSAARQGRLRNAGGIAGIGSLDGARDKQRSEELISGARHKLDQGATKPDYAP
jgi:Ribonuclease G/E